jgi:hypothetical protein
MSVSPRPGTRAALPRRAWVSSTPLRALASSALTLAGLLAGLLAWCAPAGAVDIFATESQRMRRLVGASDVAVVATVVGIDTMGFRDMVGEPAVRTRLSLQVDRQLMGQPVAGELPIMGPDVLNEKSEKNPLADPFGSIERVTGLAPGVRAIMMLRADPRTHSWALVPGGVFLVKGDTIVVESRWGGRRWLINVGRPLIEDGVDIGAHISVDDMGRWFSIVEQKRLLGIRQKRATLVAFGVVLDYLTECDVPGDMRCFRVGLDQVISVDRDSVARTDEVREASPLNETGFALDHLSGARSGEAIKVMLPGYFMDWGRARQLLLLEPGPKGSNIWVPAFDGFGAQPLVGTTMARCNVRLE